MDALAQALDTLEAHGSTLDADSLAAYTALRGDLERLVTALFGMGGDHARVGAVIEHLLRGADSVIAKTPDAPPQNSL